MTLGMYNQATNLLQVLNHCSLQHSSLSCSGTDSQELQKYKLQISAQEKQGKSHPTTGTALCQTGSVDGTVY